jgi:subtilase family serine protease
MFIGKTEAITFAASIKKPLKQYQRLSTLLATAFLFSVCALPLCLSTQAQSTGRGSVSAKPRVEQRIDQGSLVTLRGHMIKALTPDRDLGIVEDAKPLRLYLNLQRSAAQQKDLDTLISEQQNPASPNFHKWLTPEQFGERFGVAQSDINEITHWLGTQGFEVTSVAKNASVINFTATAGGVNHTFHAQLHYWNIAGGRYAAPASEPAIPAALAGVVSGIAGLNQIPAHKHHTPIHQERYDAETHKWYSVEPAGAEAASTQSHFHASNGAYDMTPQDFYTIYNVNPTFNAGNRGAGSTIGIIGSGPFNYGTVSGGNAGGTATGGDVVTFRKLFGITTPLNLQIQHGSANFPCIGGGGDDSAESALDVEWSSALAPAATIIFNDCQDTSDTFLTEVQALVDANQADVISSSLGFSEPNVSLADTQGYEAAFTQAAAQGQTVLSAQGDSGSNDVDFGAPQGTHGLSVDYPGSSALVLSIGGTDFQDKYDVDHGSSIPQSTYWGATNSQFYGDALTYVPETTWNDSCASPLIAITPQLGGQAGESTATYCNSGVSSLTRAFGSGGGGGLSIFFAQPSWQTGVPGLNPSVTKRATPDVSLFSSGGNNWGHGLVLCDSSSPGSACTSPDTFGVAGGTSFAAPQFAGILGLLKTGTGTRQGLIQPALYALARAQYAAGTACYANGQTANTGITNSLPASSCIFNDVTTSGNGNECVAGSTDCFSNPGASYGVLTASGSTSTFVDGYAAGAKYDLATGLGSVNVTNLIKKWNTAFSSTTSLSATPSTITSAQSTVLKATVTGGTPAGYDGTAPVLAGSVSFNLGGMSIGNCTLASGTCSISVAGTALQLGSNSITATFTSTGAYPMSTSSAATVTVTAAQASQTITFGPLPNVTYPNPPNTVNLTATASSGLPVSYTVSGPATVSGSTLTVTGTGTITVTASQSGNGSYSAATPVQQSFTSTATVVAGTTVLSESVSVVNLGGSYQETVRITNSGTGTAQKVTLTTVALGAANANQSLPSVVGNIAPGGSTTVVFTFPSTAGSPGATVAAKFAGNYTGGTFSGSVRATLPQSAQ